MERNIELEKTMILQKLAAFSQQWYLNGGLSVDRYEEIKQSMLDQINELGRL